MKQANLIIGSKEVLATLNRTAAARIKADGENCSHLMHEIGMTDEEGYDDQLQIAKSTAVVTNQTKTFCFTTHSANKLECNDEVNTSCNIYKTPSTIFTSC